MKFWTKWNRKMGGRSFNITSGALVDTLLFRTPNFVLAETTINQKFLQKLKGYSILTT